MFTGLITHLGKVSKIKVSHKNDTYVGIDIKWNDDLIIGSSVCCNGVCLTVVDKKLNYFGVELSNETIKRTRATRQISSRNPGRNTLTLS